jgi:DNA-binding SARP family transcriptional activator/streptogramin lyase
MRFLLLGPFSIMDGDRPTAVGRGNERALIALLALHADTAVSTDRIIDGLWGDRPPATARDMVRLYVSRARSRVGDRLVTEATGYRLRTEEGEIDVAELERLRRAGAESIAAGDADAAATLLAEAIGLVRGEPLAEFGDFPFAREEIPRLDELRLGTTEEYYDALLSSGEATELVPALEQLVEENPYRERLRGQLMLALYRAGRQTDALARYQEGRRLLADEVGIEPSPRLRELERAILQHDPALIPDRRKKQEAVRSAGSAPRRRSPRLAPAVLALVVVAAGITALAITQTRGSAGLAALPQNSVGVVDPDSGKLESAIRLHGTPVDLTGSAGRIWAALGEPHAVAEIDPGQRTLAKTTPLPVVPRRIGSAPGGVWVADSYRAAISRVDAAGGDPGRPQWPFGRDRVARISFASAPGTLWVAGDLVKEAAQVDPRTGRVIQQVGGLVSPYAIAIDFGALWLASANTSVIERVRGKETHQIQIGAPPTAVATGGKAVWAVSQPGGALYRINPVHWDVAKVIQVGRDPTSVAFGHGSVWVGSRASGTVERVDPQRNGGEVVQTIHIGRPVAALSFYDGRLWVAAG